MIIVTELCNRYPVCPVILSMIHEDLEVGLNLLVNSFSLSISLGMICHGGSRFDAKQSV